MTWGLVASAAVTVVGGAIAGSQSAGAARDAANTQANAARDATSLQKYIYDNNYTMQKPFVDAGVAGENRLLDLLGLSKNTSAPGYGSMAKSFSAADFQADPGYQFRLDEGLKALDKQAAARGGLISGAALKAASGYAGDQASAEYQNAYNRYNTNRAAILNPLQSLAGQGQTQSNALAEQGTQYATNAGNNMMAAGNARASGYVGSANAWNAAIGTGVNGINNAIVMNRMYPSSTGTGWSPDPQYNAYNVQTPYG